jgi:hypothetical protein
MATRARDIDFLILLVRATRVHAGGENIPAKIALSGAISALPGIRVDDHELKKTWRILRRAYDALVEASALARPERAAWAYALPRYLRTNPS